jgi:ABC-type polysaccharide/polyol phosphate transport system ATPase subunit
MTVTQATRGAGRASSVGLAVQTTGLTKRFGDRTVVDKVDLAIPAGSVCGFVGPNGAGKTTTIRMLLGLIRPTEGGGSILGGSLTEPASYLDKVGALIEAPAFYPQLSGRDNLKALARLGRLNVGRVGPALARAGLTERAGDKYRSYSLGMKQRLGIVFAAVVAFVVAVVAMHARHGSTTAWFNSTGMADLFRALGNISLAVVGYSILGLVIGLFVRSAVFAVILGFAWMIAIENIVTRIVPSAEKWMPGMALEAVATGGGEGVDYSRGLLVGAVYLVVAVIAAALTFARRDVTA